MLDKHFHMFYHTLSKPILWVNHSKRCVLIPEMLEKLLLLMIKPVNRCKYE